MRPFVGRQVGHSVGSVLQDIVHSVDSAIFDLGDFCPDRLEGVDKPVDLEFVFTLGGLNHESSDNGPAHGGCVESVVNHALGNVCLVNVCGFLEDTTVKDQLVGTATLFTFKHDLIGIL